MRFFQLSPAPLVIVRWSMASRWQTASNPIGHQVLWYAVRQAGRPD